MSDRSTALRAVLEGVPEGGPAREAPFLALGHAGHDPDRAAVILEEALTGPPVGEEAPHLATAMLRVHHRGGAAPGRDALGRWYPLLVSRHQARHRDTVDGLPVGTADAGPARHDVVFLSLAVQADRDLAEIASLLGYNPEPFAAWALSGARAVDTHLWDGARGRYLDREPGTGRFLPTPAAASASPLYAAVPSRERADLLVGALGDAAPAPDRPELLWMLSRGLERYGYPDRADAVTARLEADARAGSPLAAALALDLQAGR